MRWYLLHRRSSVPGAPQHTRQPQCQRLPTRPTTTSAPTDTASATCTHTDITMSNTQNAPPASRAHLQRQPSDGTRGKLLRPTPRDTRQTIVPYTRIRFCWSSESEHLLLNGSEFFFVGPRRAPDWSRARARARASPQTRGVWVLTYVTFHRFHYEPRLTSMYLAFFHSFLLAVNLKDSVRGRSGIAPLGVLVQLVT